MDDEKEMVLVRYTPGKRPGLPELASEIDDSFDFNEWQRRTDEKFARVLPWAIAIAVGLGLAVGLTLWWSS